MKIKCACKKYQIEKHELWHAEADLPIVEFVKPNKLKRYRAIKHDVNKCKAV